MKKIRVKKKILLIPIIIIIVVAVGIGGYYLNKTYTKNTVKKIKNVFSPNVVTIKDARLYDKNKKVVGTIVKDYKLELEDIRGITIKDTHLRIKGTSYYIHYKDIKKDEEKEKDKEVVESYYVPMDKTIKTSKPVALYEQDKVVINLNKGIKDVEIEKIDDNYYYILFLNRTLQVKKSKDIKEIDKDIAKQQHRAIKIPVIYYDKIQNDCGGDDTCLLSISVKNHINKLKNEGYYFITKDDFVNYIKGYINVKDKAIFLATGNVNDEVNKINEELKVNIGKVEEKDGIKLVVTNKAATNKDPKDKVNCYQAKRYTIIDKYSEMAQGKDIVDNGRENSTNQGIAVINYHFFYDETIPGESQACNESICLEKKKLEEHFKWLNDNGYKTLTIKEYADWMDGIIEIPDKSVLLTIDDGAHGTGKHNGNVLIPALEKYKIHATLFLITGWWDLSNYQSPYLDVQSHTNNLHYEDQCADGRGKVACSDYATVKKDLQDSINVLKDTTSFCFPFYSYDSESLRAVQELGFRDAFIGGSVKSRRSNNHLLIPRYPIMSDVTLNDFIYMVS